MHIPTGETVSQEIIAFRQALEQEAPDRPYDRNRWLYVPDHYSEYRYLLGTRGRKPLVAVGINPSTAAPDDLDNTLKSVQRIAAANGYDSFLMFNVYAQRATRPDDMDRQFNETLHWENMEAFRYCLSLAGEHPAVWAAWGAIIEKREYLMDCVWEMAGIGQQYGAVWLKAGPLSKKGHPHHPLYLKKDCPLEPFPMEDYLNTQRNR